MQENFFNISHPLVRDGRSQFDRISTKLSPEKIKVDDRSMEEMLEYIFNYAQQVNFINPQNFDLEYKDNWIKFFSKSDPFQLALIGRFNYQKIKKEYNEQFQKVSIFSQPSSLNNILDIISDAIFQIASWQNGLEYGRTALKIILSNLISTNLIFALKRLIGCINVARGWGYEPKRSFNELDWGLTHTDFFELRKKLKGKGVSQKQKIIRTRLKLDQIFQVVFKAMKEIVEAADDSLQFFFEENQGLQDQPPHLGLLFAFLKVFDEVRADLNNLSARHLEFFFNKVLKLDLKAPVSDKTHLVFELTKHINSHKLEKGIFFKSGKDDQGNEVQFQLENEVILNKAKVEHLKTLYLNQCPKKKDCLPPGKGESDENPSYLVGGVYSAPVANSLDGQGEDFQEDNSSWETLGFDQSKQIIKEGQVNEYTRKHPFAISGMILASPVLLLQEGEREVTITFNLDTSELDNCIRNDDGTLNDEGNSFLNSIMDVNNNGNPLYYITFDEEVIQELPNQGIAPEIIDYFDKYKNQAFTITQFNDLVNNRTPLAKRDINPFLDDRTALLNLSNTSQLPFDLFFTGEKGWLPPSDLRMIFDASLSTLTFIATFKPEDDAVTFFDAELLEEDYDTHLPAVKILLNQSIQFQTPDSETACLWHYFSKIRIEQAKIEVNVCGVKDLIVQNDDGLMQVGKPIYPFGTIPRQGDNFYIGNREIFCKNWGQVQVNLSWEKNPNEISNIYRLYQPSPTNSSSFSLRASLLENKDWEGPTSRFNMFSNRGLTICPLALNQHFTFDKTNFTNQSIEKDEIFNAFTEYNPDTIKGFLRLRLDNFGAADGDDVFLHEAYAKAVARQALAKSKHSEDKPLQGAIYKYTPSNPEVYLHYPSQFTNAPVQVYMLLKNNLEVRLPEQPYTPIIKEISLDYSAKAMAYPDSSTEISTVDFIHLYPCKGNFKEEKFPEFQPSTSNLTFPRFVPHFENEGHLFIGLKYLEPGADLTLFFKLAESTGNTDVEKADVKWYYLSNNNWIELKIDLDLLSDETEGLISTGIIKFSIPWEITNNNTVLPKGHFWLMAAARNRTASISETIQVHTQAARVIFVDQNNDLTRLSQPLEAGTISKLVVSDAAVKKIDHLYNSFGATPVESDDQYFTRVSEYLRHKGRGLNLYDYETMILANFPEIYKIKCVTHTLGRRGKLKDFEMSPGYVTIAIVPQILERNSNNSLTPKASHRSLTEIYKFLKKRISPFVRLRVLNPIYEKISVECKAKFIAGKNEAFYTEQLKNEILQFLAPWAFGEQGQIAFGGRVFKSSIIDFIEQKDYVDYLTDFKMMKEDGLEQNEITANTARSILTSGTHVIIPLQGDCVTDDKIDNSCDECIADSKQDKSKKNITPL